METKSGKKLFCSQEEMGCQQISQIGDQIGGTFI